MMFDDTIHRLVVSQTWQLAACAGFAGVLAWLIGFRRPHLSYAVWMLVLLKALTPPVITSPISPFSWMQGGTVVAETTAGLSPASESPVRDTVLPSTVGGRMAQSSSQVAESRSEGSSTAWGIMEVLSVVWGLGSVLVLLWIVIGQMVWRRRLHRSSLPIPGQIKSLVDDLVRRLGMRKSPQLVISSLDVGPMAGGVLRPVIVLPANILRRSPAELEPFLAHELVHLRRRDPAWAVVQWSALLLWWWNPVVWWASRSVSRERERCCDADVIGSLSYPRESYAQGLLDVLRTQTTHRLVPVPMTIPLSAVTHRRFDHILQASPFVSRPPRRHLLVALVLGLLILPGGRFAEQAISQDRDGQVTDPSTVRADDPSASISTDEAEPTVKTPELVYLTWQKDGIKSTGRPIPHTLWRPDGSLVDEQETAVALKEAGSFSVHWISEGQLHPLVFIFRIEDKLENMEVWPRAYQDDGPPAEMFSAMPSDGKTLVVSAISPRPNVWQQWPGRIRLDIKYPIEDPQIIKTINEIPDDVVNVAEGVWWYLNPDRAIEYDSITGQSRRVPDKTAGVFKTFPGDVFDLVDYRSRVYLRNADRHVSGGYTTNIEPDGLLFQIDVTKPIGSKADIERVEFTRQRFARASIENVKVRLDLLPHDAEAETDR